MNKPAAVSPPPHPGKLLEQQYLAPNRIRINEAAKRLGVARQAVSKIVNGRGSVSLNMALRLEREFGKPAQYWLGVQSAHDLWAATSARRRPTKAVAKSGRAAK